MKKTIEQHGSSSVIYFLGFIGAAIYFIGQADGFWEGFIGFLKALVWPAYMVYEAFTFFATQA